MARAKLKSVLEQTMKNLEKFSEGSKGRDYLRRVLSGTENHTVNFDPKIVRKSVENTLSRLDTQVDAAQWALIDKEIYKFSNGLKAAWGSDGYSYTREASVAEKGPTKGKPVNVFRSLFENPPYTKFRNELNRAIANILNVSDNLKFVDAGHSPGFGVSETALAYALGDNLESTVNMIRSTESSRRIRAFIEKIPEPFLKKGKAFSIQVEIEDKAANRSTGSKKNIFGFSEQEFIGVLKTDLTKILEKEDWGSMEGSPSIRRELLDHIGDAARGKKSPSKRASSKASYSKTVKDKEYIASDGTPIDIKGSKRQSANWASLIPIINAKLPQFVRMNMGLPSLVNRTGRFSESARVTDVTQTPQGYPSFGIGYEREPYGVFDRTTGAAPWATPARDPHTIIEKSLRQLLSDLAIGRFYVRRK